MNASNLHIVRRSWGNKSRLETVHFCFHLKEILKRYELFEFITKIKHIIFLLFRLLFAHQHKLCKRNKYRHNTKIEWTKRLKLRMSKIHFSFFFCQDRLKWRGCMAAHHTDVSLLSPLEKAFPIRIKPSLSILQTSHRQRYGRTKANTERSTARQNWELLVVWMWSE